MEKPYRLILKSRAKQYFLMLKEKILSLGTAGIFFVACFSFISGIAIASVLQVNFISAICWFAAATVSAVPGFLFWKNKIARIAAIIAVFLFLGIWRFVVSEPSFDAGDLAFYNNREATIEGVIITDPERKADKQKFKFNADIILLDDEGESLEIKGKTLVYSDLFPPYAYGDRLRLVCNLKQPEKIEDFAYDRYLARYDIYSLCYYPKIKKLESEAGSFVYQRIFVFKKKIKNIISRNSPVPESGLIAGVLIGDVEDMDSATNDDFSKSGLSHLVAVSGTNITIIAAVSMNIFLIFGLKRRFAFYASAIGLFFYVVLVGLPASAVRAGLMGFLVLWAIRLGRLNKIGNSLMLAAAGMLLANPLILRDDIGFQLSFLAILSLIHIYPRLEAIFSEWKMFGIKGLKEAALISISAQIITWPIIAVNFKQISMITVLSNVLVFWVPTALMFFSAIAIGVGFLYAPLAQLFFLPAVVLSKFIIWAAGWTAHLPYAWLSITDFNWGHTAVYYFLLGVSMRFFSIKNS